MAPSLTSSNNQSSKQVTQQTVYKVHQALLLTTIPPTPPTLNEDGAKWWEYYCGLMIEGQILSRMFITALTNLCYAHMAREILVERLKIEGLMITTPYIDELGREKHRSSLHPLWHDLEDLLVKMSKLLTDLGMTAYSAKVNNFDPKGSLNRPRSAAPPTMELPPEMPTLA